MKDTSRADDWRFLCELASKETDPQKLLELITKINRALEQCHERGRSSEPPLKVDTVLLPISKGGEYHYDMYRFPGDCPAQLKYDC